MARLIFEYDNRQFDFMRKLVEMFPQIRAQTGNSNVNHIDSNDNLNSEKILDSLRNGDLTTFKKLSPSFVHNYFYKLKNDLKPE